MPIAGMQDGGWTVDGARLRAGAVPLRADHSGWPSLPLSRGRDDGRAMAPDPDQLAHRLARRSDAELLALTPKVPDAFDVFFVRHSEAILAYIWRHTGNRDVALDLTSEAFAVALESVARYDPQKGDARGWLFGIAKITMLSSYRRQQAERSARTRLGIAQPGFTDEDWEAAESRLDAALPGLVEGIEQLPRAERRAVVARVLEERDYSEIAASEQATEAAIRQRVKRGLGRLRKRMPAEEDER
jgi:RNA polymerase sigma factor (sigma-70 family)